jgi:putative Mg2+ transporter-C (MgtC) family protein
MGGSANSRPLMPIIDPAFEKDALDLIMAVLLGGVIGFERQWRQRLAGLRTNTLVSLGRRDFRGFRWAIHRFQSNTGRRAGRHRHRFSRRRGDLEGRRQCTRPEHRGDALVFGRWRSVGRLRLLAPRHPRRRSRCRRQSRAAALVGLINRQPIESAEIEISYVVNVTCLGADEAQIRALLVQGFGVSDLHLRELESIDIEGTKPGCGDRRARIYRRALEPGAERDGGALADGEYNRLTFPAFAIPPRVLQARGPRGIVPIDLAPRLLRLSNAAFSHGRNRGFFPEWRPARPRSHDWLEKD